jgi:hypothetical protein
VRALAEFGISVAKAIPEVMETMGKMVLQDELSDPNKVDLHLPTIEEVAAFAAQELEAGFPWMHAHTLVAFWRALEVGIEYMTVGMFMNEPLLLQNETFSKLRIPLAEFEMLEQEERMRVLVVEAERGSGLGRRQGVDAFEGLLQHLGLSGEVRSKACCELVPGRYFHSPWPASFPRRRNNPG